MSGKPRKPGARGAAAPALNAPVPAAQERGSAGPPRWVRYFIGGVAACGVVLALAAMAQSAGRAGALARLAGEGWGDYGAVIVRNRIGALWHGAIMAWLAASGLGAMLLDWGLPRRLRAAVPYALVLAVVVDVRLLSRHYVKTMPLSSLAENSVTRLLKADHPQRRVALVTQDGFYNWWLTYLFPYHGITTLNVTQMPRMPADYQRFMEAVGSNPLRYWQLAAVGYVLGPRELWEQARKTPQLQEAFELAHSYEVMPASTGVSVMEPRPGETGRHVVLRMNLPAPRYALFGAWKAAGDDEALRMLGSPSHRLWDHVLVAAENADGLPPPGAAGLTGRVDVVEYRSGRVRLRTEADVPVLLRAADKYHPAWTARVDGKTEPLRRVDFFFQGVFLPAGRHEVALAYAPSSRALNFQLAGIAVVMFSLLAVWLRRRADPKPGAAGADGTG